MGLHFRHFATAILLAAGLVACGDDEPDTTAPGNQPPAIAITSSGSFGIAQITTFIFTASVADPDGNPVAVTWSFSDGSASAGTTARRLFLAAGTIEVVATARDHTGLTTTSEPLSVTVGTATGTWSGTVDLSACEAGTKPLTATLSQQGTLVTGTVSLPEGMCSPAGGSATVGPAEPGQVFGSGAVRLRVVVPPDVDVSFEGQMTTNGQEITGNLVSGETVLPVTLTRQ